MPRTKGRTPTADEISIMAGDVRELMIRQLLDGLEHAPGMLPHFRALAESTPADSAEREVLRRFQQARNVQ